MAVSNEFLDYVLDQLSCWEGVSARRMFGGAGLYRDGLMFGLVADDVVYLRVDDSNREQFVQAGCAPFKPYKAKPTLMPYYQVPGEVLERPEDLAMWAETSYAVALAHRR